MNVRAGGNTQFRDPSNLSIVIDKTWDDRMLPITWVLSEDGLPGSGIDNATLITELTAAHSRWEMLTTSKLDWTFGGEVPIRSAGLDGPLGPGIDGVNLVTFTDPDLIFPPGVLAVAITFSFAQDTVIDSTNSDLDGDLVPDIPEGTYPAGTIFDSDIAFNSSEDWEVSGANGTFDIQAVALHEIGHSFGLAHSMHREAVMWPFLSSDIADARSLSGDDIAYASFYYQKQPEYSAAFGGISGTVINGFSSAPVLGAHVFAVDPVTGATLVGAYSGDNGSYVIPGLGGADYLVAIEPLDGDPMGLDPSRINQVVQFTLDTNFPEEFFDANEANVEADPAAGQLITVAVGSDTTGIDLVTNTVQVPGVNIVLEPGYNLLAYPVEAPTGLTAFDLLQAVGDDTEVNAIDRYVPGTGTFERATYVSGSPAGVNFPIERGAGYVVHMNVQKVVQFSGSTDCPTLDFIRGMNVVGTPCPPAGYSSFLMLADIGARFEIESIERFDPDTGTFQITQYDQNDLIIGDDYPISNGEGYVVKMLADKTSLRIPSPGTNLPPVITGSSPGKGVPGTIVVILGDGFDPDVTKNTVTFNGIGAGVIFATANTITTTVPSGATSGLLRVAVNGQQSNAITFDVENTTIAEIPGADTPLISGQTADGVLSLDGEQDRYTFTALAGSLITVNATSIVPGVPDLVVLIEDPFGVLVASDDNSGGGTDPRINNFELERTGVHTIVVSNVPGSGTGAYQVSLTVITRSSVPQVSILEGNFQTGLPGSTLLQPLTVLVTGATGAPLSNADVNFVATDATFGMTASLANAGTTVIATNSSGIVQVDTTLPAGSPNGTQFNITVTVDGVPTSQTFVLWGNNKIVSQIEVNGDMQTGTVGQQLTNPLEVVLKDNIGEFVGDAYVAFEVISGGGTLGGPACAGRPSAVCFKTDGADGLAGATFTLGTNIDDPQLVAAFIPGMVDTVIFEATPEADSPIRVVSNKTNFNRLTLGTSVLNAMQVQVFDQFDNVVAGTTVTYTPSGGLLVSPGLGPNGEVFSNFLTNSQGLHVAALAALNGSTDPTINEFGASVAGVYNVTASVSGGPSENFVVDVDMGPSMVTISGQNVGELIGQPLPSPVSKKVLRWERVDTFIDVNMDGMDDDDNGDFRDEDFSQLVQKGVSGVTINLEAVREDRQDEAGAGVTPLTLDSMTATTDGSGIGSVNVTDMGEVGGVKQVVGRIDGIFVEWFFEDGSLIDSNTFTDENQFGESTNLIAIPVVIKIDLDDAESGIDFSTVVVKLNGTSFFDAAAPPAVLPFFPELLQVLIGGVRLGGLDSNIIGNSAFTAIQIEYWPRASNLLGSNTVEVTLIKDNAENEQTTMETLDFNYP